MLDMWTKSSTKKSRSLYQNPWNLAAQPASRAALAGGVRKLLVSTLEEDFHQQYPFHGIDMRISRRYNHSSSSPRSTPADLRLSLHEAGKCSVRASDDDLDRPLRTNGIAARLHGPPARMIPRIG